MRRIHSPLINDSEYLIDRYWSYDNKAIYQYCTLYLMHTTWNSHYTWRSFESWYLLRLLLFHQGLLLLFSVFLGLEWLGFAKRFPSDRVKSLWYLELTYDSCHFGKEPVIFSCSVICKGTCKWANSLKPLLVYEDLRVRERLVTFPRAIAIAFKPITGCIQPF